MSYPVMQIDVCSASKYNKHGYLPATLEITNNLYCLVASTKQGYLTFDMESGMKLF